MPYHFLDSKLDRAIVAYLIECGAGTTANCFPALRCLGRAFPNITVHTTDLNIPEGDAFSGSRVGDVDVTINQNPVSDPASTDADALAKSNAQWLAFNELTGNVCDALNNWGQSSDLLCDAINAAASLKATNEPDEYGDLANFSVYGIVPLGETQGFVNDSVWQKTFKLRCHVAAQSLS